MVGGIDCEWYCGFDGYLSWIDFGEGLVCGEDYFVFG